MGRKSTVNDKNATTPREPIRVGDVMTFAAQASRLQRMWRSLRQLFGQPDVAPPLRAFVVTWTSDHR